MTAAPLKHVSEGRLLFPFSHQFDHLVRPELTNGVSWISSRVHRTLFLHLQPQLPVGQCQQLRSTSSAVGSRDFSDSATPLTTFVTATAPLVPRTARLPPGDAFHSPRVDVIVGIFTLPGELRYESECFC